MKREFEYTFKGFGGCYSKCWVRLVHHDHGPFVIVCSQTSEVVGTSVCNAHEIIRKGLESKLRSESTSQKIDLFSDLYEEHKNLPVAIVSFVANMFSRELKGDRSWYARFRESDQLFWVEHWPAAVSLQREEEYWLVRWNRADEPHWERIDPTEFAERIGYAATEIRVANEDEPAS